MIGMRFERLQVIERASDSSKAKYKCLCDCGGETLARADHLKSGAKRSCGCLRTSDGAYKTPTYRSWASMLQRCNNSNTANFAKYGGRGIKVCERWAIFENFLKDLGERPPGKSLDRKDVNGNYEPGNCRWATAKEQARNRTNNRLVEVDGALVTMSEAAERAGVKLTTFKHQLDKEKK